MNKVKIFAASVSVVCLMLILVPGICLPYLAANFMGDGVNFCSLFLCATDVFCNPEHAGQWCSATSSEHLIPFRIEIHISEGTAVEVDNERGAHFTGKARG